MFLKFVNSDLYVTMAPAPVSPTADHHCTIVVLGASGDLAFKKTYPALFGLFKNNLMPKNVHIIGYARSAIAHADFLKRISSKIKLSNDEDRESLQKFLKLNSYQQGFGGLTQGAMMIRSSLPV
jgi:glucose-6-phosphate 1-dehydrogenase